MVDAFSITCAPQSRYRNLLCIPPLLAGALFTIMCTSQYMICLLVLIIYVKVNVFSVMSGIKGDMLCPVS